MPLNLTCQKTHILAWLNLDNTLSLKINGVKYLGFPKLDKRGEKYWKCDGLSSAPSIPPAPQATEKLKEEIAAILKKPMSEQTLEDRKKWEKWTKIQAQEKLSESIAHNSQREVEALSKKLADKSNNHETSPQ